MVLELSEAEKQLLQVVRSIERRPHDRETGEKIPPTLDNFRTRGSEIFRDALEPETFDCQTFEGLIRKELLRREGEIYSLTDQGRTHANQARKAYLDKWYSDGIRKLEASQTYSCLCERVYGRDLGQLNMMTMAQLAKLLEILCLSSEHHVLDHGCGMGKITEYISDQTQASILGVDIASGAIQQAQTRTQAKSDRIEFQIADLDRLPLPPVSVDCILAIDTLYFVENLDKTIRQMKRILKPHGQMGIFYTQICRPKDSRNILKPDSTELAQALKKHALAYQTYDFSASEWELWDLKKKLLEELKTDFQAEGNLDLYSLLMEETEWMIKSYKDDKVRRYLYHVLLL